jgi:integrase
VYIMDRKNVMAKRPRGTGCLYQQPGSEIWWVQFHQGGKRHRESTETDSKREATTFLRDKLAEVSLGTYSPRASQVTVTELVESKLTADKNNNLKSLNCSEGRWRLHLQPFFGHLKAANVTSPLLGKYIEKRQGEGAVNVTINRELQFLRAAFNLARKSGIIRIVPYFKLFREDNIRKGFLRDDQYVALAQACAAEGLWLRSMFEVAQTFAWRKGELQTLRVGQLDFIAKTIRLYDSKNHSGRVAVMTRTVLELLTACCAGKGPDDFVFTRPNGKPVREFRKNWKRVTETAKCPGLRFHDLCRTGMRNMRRLGFSEGVCMKVAGRKTASIFRRYDIVDESDLREVARKLDEKQQNQFSHSLAIVKPQDQATEENFKVKVLLTQ